MKIRIFFIKLIIISISFDSAINNINERKLEEENKLLDNIIKFGGENYGFTRIAKFSTGEMIAFSGSSSVSSHIPNFYGLKKNGRPLFIKDSKETPYKSLDFEYINYINNMGWNIQYNYDDCEIIVFKTADNEEYIINIGRFYQLTESYDFKNEKIYKRQMFFSYTDSGMPVYSMLYNIRGSLMNFKESNYFVYGGLFINYEIIWGNSLPSSYKTYLILFKFYLANRDSLESEMFIQTTYSDKIEAFGNMVSCTQKNVKDIVCIYILSLTEKKYKIVNFDEDLILKKEEGFISSNTIEENIFFKCIYIDKEIFAFIYFKIMSNRGTIPIISFKEKKPKEQKFDDFKEDIYIGKNINFNTSLYLNDFILLPNKIFCFSSVSSNKEKLFIFTITIIDKNYKYIIRAYSINIYEKYNFKFYQDLRLDIFKESLIMAYSFTQGTSDTYYSSLIIFSYPNSTDYNKDIIDELFENNKYIEEIKFNLKLSDYILIENNLFCLVFHKISIESFDNCEKVKFFSSTTKQQINPIYELSENEDIIAEFNNYDKFDCQIGFSYIVTEPDLDTYDDCASKTIGDIDEEVFNDMKKNYTGRLSYYNLYLKDNLTDDCSELCGLCYDNAEKKCIVCLYNCTILDNENKMKTCLEKPIEKTESPTEQETEPPTERETEKPTDKLTNKTPEKPTDKPTEKPPIIDQNYLDVMDCINEIKSSSECNHIKVEDDQYQNVHNQVINKVLNKSSTYDGEKKVYNMENLVIQVSKYDDQDEEDKSIIDLGKCEEILRSKGEIPDDESLIIYKSDIQSKNSFSSYVDYEVYHPTTLEPLNLSLCAQEEISIKVSLNLPESTKSFINSLSKSGHDAMNRNDPFYKDICITYTTENGTDMSLTDRQNAIENTGGSLNFCQAGCRLQDYNISTDKAKCDCYVGSRKAITNINDIEFNVDFIKNIFGGLKYSNYPVLKCYKLLLDFELLKKNIGCILMTFILLSLIILYFIYFIKGRKKIEYYLNAILNNKKVYVKNRKNIKNEDVKNNKKNKSKKKLEKNSVTTENNKKGKSKFLKKNSKNISKNKNGPPIKKMKSIKKKVNPTSSCSLKNLSKTNEELNKNGIKNLNINIIPIHNINYNKSKKRKNEKFFGKKFKNKNKIMNNIYNIKSKKNTNKFNDMENNKKILDLDNINYQTLNIQELNNLEYKIALIVDKRTYFQYYCALIRKKQLIIFAFIPIEDYNLVSLKIALFLLSFSLYLCVNALFFNDSTMHDLFSGKNDLLIHIPNIIYSSLISSIVNTLLKQLSLSENILLSVKKEKKMKVIYKRANQVRIYLRFKFIIFIFISLLLGIAFWYYISCFCAVYINTQIILIKDSLISFGISMLYPFGINIFPGIFRIYALRAKTRNRICSYKFSQLLSLI